MAVTFQLCQVHNHWFSKEKKQKDVQMYKQIMKPGKNITSGFDGDEHAQFYFGGAYLCLFVRSH